MKEFLYILFCVVILGLGILILNSRGGNDSYLSAYQTYTHPGVDYSNMKNITTSYVPAQRNTTGNLGLVGSNADVNLISNNSSPLLPQYRTSQVARTTQALHSSDYNISRNQGSSNTFNVGASSAGGSVLLIPSLGTGAKDVGNNTQGRGFLAAGSTSGSNFSTVPIDPFSDYNEGDITHPGGNPVDDPLMGVPVGDGLFPLFLMGLAYVSLIIRKRYRRKLA